MADEANDFTAPVGELPSSPAGPAEGDKPPSVDSDFIMNTLFGQDAPAKPPVAEKPAGDQGDTGTKPDGGADTGTAPPTPAPAAKEREAVPQEQPPVPGASPSQPVKEQKPEGAAPETPAPGKQPAAAEPAPAETRLTPEERLQLASIAGLRQQNEQLLEMMRGQQAPQGTQPQGQQSQEEDYYKAFPGHRNPLFRTAIESEMQKMAQEMPAAPWNEDFRNALGTRVNRTLQLLGINVGMVPGAKPAEGAGAPPAAGFGAQPQGNGGSPPPPAPMLDSSNRGAAPQDAGNFIAATFT
jgi:hypothetical protein